MKYIRNRNNKNKWKSEENKNDIKKSEEQIPALWPNMEGVCYENISIKYFNSG